jgi:hypothetical protein
MALRFTRILLQKATAANTMIIEVTAFDGIPLPTLLHHQ